MANNTPKNGAAGVIVGGLVGVLLILAGVVLAVARETLWDVWVIATVLGGFILLTLLLAHTRQKAAHLSAGARRMLYSYNLFLTAAMLIGTLLIVNVMVARYGREPIDVTSNQRYSLDTRTVKLCKSLTKEAKFTVLLPRGTQFAMRLEQLMDLYRLHSDKIVPEFVDPYGEKLRMEQLKKKYGDAQPGGVIVEYGDRHKFVGHDEIFVAEVEGGFMQRQRLSKQKFKGENVLTSALNALIEGKEAVVYFTVGHGEKDVDNATKSDEKGVGLVKQELERLNHKVKKLDLVKVDRVPDDCNLLVIAGAKSSLMPDEVTKLTDYLDRGTSSKLIVCLDPDVTLGLEEKLKEFKVDVQNDMVLDMQLCYQRQYNLLLPVIGMAQHPIAADLMLQRMVMPVARSLELIQDTPPRGMPGQPPQQGPRKYVPMPLVSSSQRSWGETDLTGQSFKFDESEKQGPLTLAAAVLQLDPPMPPRNPMGGPPPTNSKPFPRLVVFGDSDFIANAYVNNGVNMDIFLNSVSWLRGRTELIGIEDKEDKPLTLDIADDKLAGLLFKPALAMLGLLVLAGAVVFVVRTRR